MSTERIGDLDEPQDYRWEDPKGCMHPEHKAPTHMVFAPGRYKHTCPGCSESYIFTVGHTFHMGDNLSTSHGTVNFEADRRLHEA